MVKEAASANWNSAGGKKGLPDEYFTLDGYGLKYYEQLNLDSLISLNEHLVNTDDRVDDIIQTFNDISEDIQLYDFNRSFFNRDSLNVGGFITNTKRSLQSQLTKIRFEYGITERVTLTLGIPNYASATQENQWGWEGTIDDSLNAFIKYHTENKQKFNDLGIPEDLSNSYDISEDLKSELNKIYEIFYTADGRKSVLRLVENEIDPFKSSITGAQFNPFSNSDNDTTNIDSLMIFYHPNRSTSGLGDIRWGLNFHLLGSPVWAGESLFSIYGGIGMTIPTAKLISKFNPDKVDGTGRPKQFSELQLGNGVTALHFSLFGELYKTIQSRELKINWATELKINPKAKFWQRVTPRGTYSVQHDSILSQIGEVYRFRRGDEFFGSLVGSLELIPRKLRISVGQTWYLKIRDSYYSKNERWNEWMAGGTDLRKNYDTQSVMIIQDIALILQNTDPMNQFGSTPFEVELSATVPVLTKHAWSAIKVRLSFVTYFQLW